MASDIDYNDRFIYNSSQDHDDIEYQIDLFEFHYYVKSNKKSKQKMNKSSCRLSRKTLKSQSILLKNYCMHYKKTPKAQSKPFRYNRLLLKPSHFECDQRFRPETMPSTCAKDLETEHSESFHNFRRHFYCLHHHNIKSSLQIDSYIQITNIRLASIDPSVQKSFMKILYENTSDLPHLVYHGTKVENMQSVLQYGFLIPNESHPTNAKAPMIRSVNGQAYGKGIYSSQTASYSLSYTKSTNTLLGCAAIPEYNEDGKVRHLHGDILVLTEVSRIIPLFLIDFQYLNESNINYPYFDERKPVKIYQKKNIKTLKIISRKYLRKVLTLINDQKRKNNQYQQRIFSTFSNMMH